MALKWKTSWERRTKVMKQFSPNSSCGGTQQSLFFHRSQFILEVLALPNFIPAGYMSASVAFNATVMNIRQTVMNYAMVKQRRPHAELCPAEDWSGPSRPHTPAAGTSWQRGLTAGAQHCHPFMKPVPKFFRCSDHFFIPENANSTKISRPGSKET